MPDLSGKLSVKGYGYIDEIEIARDRSRFGYNMLVERIYESIQQQFCPGCPLEAVVEARKNAAMKANGWQSS